MRWLGRLGVDVEVQRPTWVWEIGLSGRNDGPRVFGFEEERQEESGVVLVEAVENAVEEEEMRFLNQCACGEEARSLERG